MHSRKNLICCNFAAEDKELCGTPISSDENNESKYDEGLILEEADSNLPLGRRPRTVPPHSVEEPSYHPNEWYGVCWAGAGDLEAVF